MKRLIYYTLLLCVVTSSVMACSGDDGVDDGSSSSSYVTLVTNISVPTYLTAYVGASYTLTGSGFLAGDILRLESGLQSLDMTLAVASSTSATFEITTDIVYGNIYKMSLVRGSLTQALGSSIFQTALAVNLTLPSEIISFGGGELTILGEGFREGDGIEIRVQSDEYVCDVTSVDEASITFEPPTISTLGACELYLVRGGLEQSLGASYVINSVADKAGATIKGLVTSGGVGVAGVHISDGDLITTTDQDGCYWLESEKRNGLVFVILPSGYEVECVASQPKFWSACTLSASECEQHNFELYATDNSSHKVIVSTDMHLANRNSDYFLFELGFINEMKNTYNNSSEKIYALNLGDFSWDLYWYANNWALPECLNEIKDLEFPMWITMGNHDNDPYKTGDFNCESTYRELVGPVYYSMNLGDVHYIMLDNTVYTNTGGTQGTVGSRDYSKTVEEHQLAWLKLDLAKVDKSTPIVLGMHCPVYTYGWYSSTSTTYRTIAMSSESNVIELLNCFDGFDQVNIVTGHTHVNRSIQATSYPNVYEQNVAAVCGTWWWTRKYTALNVCTDGSPAGYKLFDVNGTDIEWSYKGVDVASDKQFITYDMNNVLTYWSTDSTAQAAFNSGNLSGRSADYDGVGSNMVYLNVWAYEPGWDIVVKESGVSLTVSQVWCKDPLHSICYDIPRGSAGSSLTFPSTDCMHMFAVQCSSASSTLDISVTDNFGNTYTETMTRPKAFTTSLD